MEEIFSRTIGIKFNKRDGGYIRIDVAEKDILT